VKTTVQSARKLVDLQPSLRIREEREEIAGRAAAFSRPELSPTVKVENELHDRIIEQNKNLTRSEPTSKIRKAASRRDRPTRA
jgi:hypothetical protein